MKLQALFNFISAVFMALLVNSALLAENSAVQLKGELTQGAMVTGSVNPGSQVSLNGKSIGVTPQGDFVIGFGRDATLNNELRISAPDGTEQRFAFKLVKREYKIQRIEGISKKIMSPNKADIERAKQDSRDIGVARKTRSHYEYFLQPFIWPAKGPITGVYGSQRFYNGKPSRPHYGLDIAGPKGSDVVAPADGEITLTKNMFYSGNTILLDHGFGISSTFIHLDTISVKVGQKVKQGEKIGTIGASGRVTGPHLDWRLNWFSERLDPYLLVKHIDQ